MKTPQLKSWSLRLITLTVWLLAVLCSAYWVLKFVKVKPVNTGFAAAAPAISIDSDSVAKFLGAPNSVAGQPIITPASSNYALFGIVRALTGTGVALIATDGKPAKPYRVGNKVSEDLVLKSITRTEAVLASSVEAPDGMKLELPARIAAAGSNTPMAPIAANGRSGAPLQLRFPTAANMPTSDAATAGRMGAAMANAANPAGTNSFIPVQPDSNMQRPSIRMAPNLQGDPNVPGRAPIPPPDNPAGRTSGPGSTGTNQ